MNHEESKLQQQCVAWFRAQYPQYAMLLVHPINEGSGHSRTDRFRQGIHKAEGAVAGVPDLLLFLPNKTEAKFELKDGRDVIRTIWFHGLGIEFKTKKGTQSQTQKDFERIFEAAGYIYTVMRSFEEFQIYINNWIKELPHEISGYIIDVYKAVIHEREEKEKEKFYKIIGKK